MPASAAMGEVKSLPPPQRDERARLYCLRERSAGTARRAQVVPTAHRSSNELSAGSAQLHHAKSLAHFVRQRQALHLLRERVSLALVGRG